MNGIIYSIIRMSPIYAIILLAAFGMSEPVSAGHTFVNGKLTIDGSDIGDKTLKEIVPEYVNSITELEIVGEIESIPHYFAERSESLEKIVLPESCKEIWGRAFAECPKLYSVKAPGVKNLRGSVFESCTNLSSIEFPVLENLREDDFYKTNIDLNDLPETLKYVYEYSVYTYRNIDSYTLTPNITPNDTYYHSPAIMAEVGTLEINHQFPLVAGYKYLEPSTILSLGIKCNTLILGEGMKEFNPYIFTENFRPNKIVIPGSEMIQYGVVVQYYSPGEYHQDNRIFYSDFPKDWRENVTLYVADNLVEKYKADKYWNQLKIYSLSGEYSGVEDVTADGNGLDVEVADGVLTVNGEEGQSVEIYSLDGKRVAAGMTGQPLNVGKGLHIIRCGTAAKKVMVK